MNDARITMSMDSFDVDNLVLDAAPLLSTASASSASALRGLAKHFITTPDVVAEIRDKTSRELFAATLQILGLDTDITSSSSSSATGSAAEGGDGVGGSGSGSANNSSQTGGGGGLRILEPSSVAVAKVTNFAKLTGDIAVLSQADIRVLALTYDLEVEKNGTRRLRAAPGQLSQEEVEREQRKQERLAKVEAERKQRASEEPAGRGDSAFGTPEDSFRKLSLEASTSRSFSKQATIGGSSCGLSTPLTQASVKDESISDAASSAADTLDTASNADTIEGPSIAPSIATQEPDSRSTVTGEDGNDSDYGEWITPKNVRLHMSRDAGLFPALPASAPESVVPAPSARRSRAKVVLKVACLTGDFAMQNVALQMGLNVFGVGGKKVREVRTWILRCHACFKLCKDPTKKFCPSCGNPSLLRTSITYFTPTPENPKGYVLHLKANYQYHLRGTQYSMPAPKHGSSNALKNTGNSELILREDQKEWQRGVKRAEIAKNKQERAAAKSMKEGRGNATFGGTNFADPDWTPGMMLGEAGRSGGPAGVRTGKDGLPIIGFGRRNPNESRRRH